MNKDDIKKIFKARFDKARERWDAYRTDMRDLYRFAFPAGECLFDDAKSRERTVYDSVLARAIERRVKKTHSALFPPYREFMDFDPADPAAVDESPENKDKWDKIYADAKKKFHLAIMDSNFHTEFDLAGADMLLVFSGFAVHEGTAAHPLVFEAIHPAMMYPGRAFEGIVREKFRRQSMPFCEIKDYWPDAVIDKEKENETAEAEVVDGYLFDAQKRVYTYVVTVADEVVLYQEDIKNPDIFIIRSDGKTGSDVGYSRAMSVLPDVRSADKTRELLLKKAAFDLNGIWAAEDGSVVNVDALKDLKPGDWVFFNRNSQLPKPLYNGTGFDLSQMVLSDLHSIVQNAVEGPTLPAENSGSRRSAYEYQLRQGEIDATELPSYLRLLYEMQPVFDRVVEILTDPKFADSPYYIRLPDVTVKGKEKKLSLSPVSPMIRKQDEADNQRSLQALTVALQINPQSVADIVDIEGYLRAFLDNGGFPSEFIRPAKEVEQQRQARAQAEQQAEMMAQARAQAEQQAPDPSDMTEAAGVVLPQEGVF